MQYLVCGNNCSSFAAATTPATTTPSPTTPTGIYESCAYLPLNYSKLIDDYRVIHIFLYIPFPDPCKTEGCNAPYNIGCRAVNNKAQCICPTCPNILRPVCTSDHVQDLSECHMKKQACELNIDIAVEKRGACGMLGFVLISYTFFVVSF